MKIIKPGAIEHDGFHSHSNDHQPFHFCDIRYTSDISLLFLIAQSALDARAAIISAFFLQVWKIRLSSTCQTNSSSGHTQKEHVTWHGSMSRTRESWEVDGPEGSRSELGRHKFPSNNGDALMPCNKECASIGRHVHIDTCHGDPHDPEAVHINGRILPNPEQDKDWITHDLHWRRMGEFIISASAGVLLMRLSLPGFKGNWNNVLKFSRFIFLRRSLHS